MAHQVGLGGQIRGHSSTWHWWQIPGLVLPAPPGYWRLDSWEGRQGGKPYSLSEQLSLSALGEHATGRTPSPPQDVFRETS